MKALNLSIKMFLICMCISTFAYSQVSSLSEARVTKWEKTKDSDEIIIYEGNVLADGAVPLKGHVIINHPIDKVVTVMADTKGKMNWLPAVQKIEILEQQDEYHKIEYFLVEMPFIVSNRTTVLESVATVSEDKSEIIVKVISSKNFPEKNKNHVRANMDFGEVRLKSIDNGQKTIVSGIFYTDPEGMLPNWVVKRFTRQFVYESLVKLRDLVGRNVYSPEQIQTFSNLIKNYHKSNRYISSTKTKK